MLGVTCLSGVEVDREGDEVAGRGADVRVRVVELTLIGSRTRVVMDRKYAQLVDAQEALS
jgi:hypothetical protein